MKKVKDLTGNEYNGIKVIERDYEKEECKKDRKVYWKCICHCGKTFSPIGNNLKTGTTKSCGCQKGGREISKNGKNNKWIVRDDMAIGITSNNINFLIDLDDLEKVKKYCWRVDRYGYVVANSKDMQNKTIRIYRIVMNVNDGEIVDHVNWNKLDNRKSNLRICTKSENNVNIKRKSNNTSGYTGVKMNAYGNWVAQIDFNNKRIHLGTFKTIDEAVFVRHIAEKNIHKNYNGDINRKDFIKFLLKE